MIRVVLVDDELPALDAIQYLLKSYQEIEIAGNYTDPGLLMDEIVSLNPDVVFLDIEMRDANGLNIAEILYGLLPELEIVFITAYDEYAVQAFELEAIDYLLKPVSRARLEKTIQRIMRESQEKGNKGSNLAYGNARSAPHYSVHVRCFGRFQVSGREEGKLVKWRTAKSEELFALLIHHEGSALHKDFIIEQWCPNMTYDNALVKLHTSVYQIRKVIKSLDPAAELRYSQDCYQLYLSNLQSDVNEFKNRVKEAETLHGEQLIKVVDEAMDIYRGHYLDDNGYLWSIEAGKRLADLLADLLMRAASSYIDRQLDKDALPYLEQLVDQHPLHEGYYRELLPVYARLHDYASLTNLYEKLKNALQQELGSRPHPDTTILYERLLVRD